MHALAQFDRLLSQSHALPSWSPSAQQPVRRLLDPSGEVVAELDAAAGAAQILKAAHRLADDDWCGVLAEEGTARRPAWRLALFLAQRHGQALLNTDQRPVWLSPALGRGAASRPDALLKQAREAAVQALWRAGWRLR